MGIVLAGDIALAPGYNWDRRLRPGCERTKISNGPING